MILRHRFLFHHFSNWFTKKLCLGSRAGVIYIYIYIFPKQLSAVGVLAVYLLLAGMSCANFRRCGDQLLCAGCGLGDGRVAPVYAKCSVISLSTEKHNGFGIFYPDASRCLQMPPDASRCLQMPPDTSKMPSRCPPDASRCLPDASQMPPRCLQMPPDASRCLQMRCLQIPPDASRCLQMPQDVSRCFQMPPRCLHIHRRLFTE